MSESKKKQFCGYCPEDKCLLDCEICNPKKGSSHKWLESEKLLKDLFQIHMK